MSIQISCSVCGTSYNVNPTVIGKRLKCKDCGQAFVASTNQPLPPTPPPLPTPPRVAVMPPPIPMTMGVRTGPPPLPVRPLAGDSQTNAEAAWSPITWFLGVNLAEQISVGVAIGLTVLALLVGGDVGMVIGGVLSTLLLFYFSFAAYWMARTAGRNGFGIVQMLIPFYIIPFSIDHWPLMKWPVARMARVGGIFLLLVLVFVRVYTTGGLSNRKSTVANVRVTVPNLNPTVINPAPKPPRKPSVRPPTNNQTTPPPPPVMVEQPKSAEQLAAEAKARAETFRKQEEARRLALMGDPNAPPRPIDGPISLPPRPKLSPTATNSPRTIRLAIWTARVNGARSTFGVTDRQISSVKLTPNDPDANFLVYGEAIKEEANDAKVPTLKPGDVVGKQSKFTLGESSEIDEVNVKDQPFARVRENGVARCYAAYIDGYRVTVFYVGVTAPAAETMMLEILESLKPINSPR